jgi:hypothetical protein
MILRASGARNCNNPLPLTQDLANAEFPLLK